MTVISTWDSHRTPLPLAYLICAWSTARDVTEKKYCCRLSTCSKPWNLEWWPTQEENESLSRNYLHSTVILISIPVCSIQAEYKFIWCHPLIIRRPPLRGYFFYHPLLPQVNLQVLSNGILECWPGTGASTCLDIVKAGLPWFVRWSMIRRSCHCAVWYLFIFHSKGLNGAFCGEKDKLLLIYSRF